MSREETVIAYVDGELAGPDLAAFEAELARDPTLSAEVEAQRRLKARIVAAYAPVLDEPVPTGLAMAASAANDRGGIRWAQWGAVAASLVVGVLAGRMFLPERGPLESHGGVLVARGELAKALDTRLAADPGVVRVGLSFRTADGAYCRTFQSAPDRLAGLACRRAGRWAADTVAAWDPAAQPAYRTAGADTPAAVLAAVDARIRGEALDAAAERAARDAGWDP